MSEEFKEIGHSGGKITFTIKTDEEGGRTYQVGYSGNRPVPTVIMGVYALPEGIPVAHYVMGGLGSAGNPPPVPSCLPVLIGSDSQGKFGHHCPQCRGYWRSGSSPIICPYCAGRFKSYQLLSNAQRQYVERYCDVLSNALEDPEDSEIVIDMDEVADAVGKETEKPSFYVSEESQQHKFTCAACDEFNDILGRYGYCSTCGTRNDIVDFESHSIPEIRDRLNADDLPENCLRDAVSEFESYMAQGALQLIKLVPLSRQRQDRLSKSFHHLEETHNIFLNWFDIDIFIGMNQSEQDATTRMFYRRHIYEHNGGVVDQKYLDKSGDTDVRVNQRIKESKGSVHDFLGSLVKMARNYHNGFHELIPPISEPIERFTKRKEMRERHKGS